MGIERERGEGRKEDRMYEKGNEPSPVPWFLETGILGKEASGGGRKERARDDGGKRRIRCMHSVILVFSCSTKQLSRNFFFQASFSGSTTLTQLQG